ncbi:MAG: O-antigen ligase family protein, partial [Rhizobiaceae bacterium]
PAPYELLLSAMLGVWLLFGMRIPREVLPLLLLLTLFNIGGVISSFQGVDWSGGLIYVAVSYFLALTSVFFAILIMQDMGRLRLIFRAYVVAALITSLLGIAGYLGVIPGSEIFTKYSRAMGAFQDPNVFGPFLTVPILYLIYGIVNRSVGLLPIRIGLLGILSVALLLSFSRAAWGMTFLSAILFYGLLIINEQKAKTRLKYIIIAIIGSLAGIVMIAGLIQLDVVSDLLDQRLKLVQDYDGGRGGRFARHAQGYLYALETPLGVGPLRFGFIFGADTHNNFLKALMDYGWIGFASWVTLLVVTVAAGFKLLFRQRPWLPYFQIAYVVFIGHHVIGNVIDTDHWRHFYLLMGIIWGCIGLELRWQRDKARREVQEGSFAKMPVSPTVTAD